VLRRRYYTTEKALEVVKDWDPFVPELIKNVLNGSIFDWKMMWRDPQPQWVSKGGRIVQLGDAAHPFLPTSASGASMAMEDAWSLTVCLNIDGKDNVPLATAMHNKPRYVQL
jgi:2-polyprenyl-6-methoxyphenol hydroxylase-like FAD-dependent oxidoreductase